jgi:hypothetical protein
MRFYPCAHLDYKGEGVERMLSRDPKGSVVVPLQYALPFGSRLNVGVRIPRICCGVAREEI